MKAKAFPLANPWSPKKYKKENIEGIPVKQLLTLHYDHIYKVTGLPWIWRIHPAQWLWFSSGEARSRGTLGCLHGQEQSQGHSASLVRVSLSTELHQQCNSIYAIT